MTTDGAIVPGAMTHTMDATALLAYLLGEPGAPVVTALLRDPANVCLVHGLNLCEVYYHYLRDVDVAAAEAVVARLLSLGLQVREDMDTVFWKDVGFLKVTYAPLSLGDACCLALARRTGTLAVTADHHEMDKVDAAGAVPIRFIR